MMSDLSSNTLCCRLGTGDLDQFSFLAASECEDDVIRWGGVNPTERPRHRNTVSFVPDSVKPLFQPSESPKICRLEASRALWCSCELFVMQNEADRQRQAVSGGASTPWFFLLSA